MALEDLTGTGKYIDDLVATNPVGSTDTKNTLDDHIRGVKNVLKNSLPAITGPITATQDELNKLDGFAGNVNDLNVLSGASAASVLAADLQALAGIAAGGITPTEIIYLNGVTSNIQAQLTNALSRSNHTGTQTLSTISDSGALAALSEATTDVIETGVHQYIFESFANNPNGYIEITLPGSSTWVSPFDASVSDYKFDMYVPANATTLNYFIRGSENTTNNTDLRINGTNTGSNASIDEGGAGITAILTATGSLTLASGEKGGVSQFSMQCRNDFNEGSRILRTRCVVIWFT